MELRARVALAMGVFVVAGIFVSCSVSVDPGGDGSGPSLSFTIAEKTFTFTLGSVGQFTVTASGGAVQKAAAIPLFDEAPTDAPSSAAIELDISQVQAIPLGVPKLAPSSQVVSGTVDVLLRIGSATSTNPCADGIDVGTFRLSVDGNLVTVDQPSLALPSAALAFAVTGQFTICLDVSATIDLDLTIEEFDCVFGPPLDTGGGDAGNSNTNQNDNGTINGNENVNDNDNGNTNGNVNTNDNGAEDVCGSDADCLAGELCELGVCVPDAIGNGNTNDNGSDEIVLQVPIDENGDAAMPNDTIDGVDYWTGTADENAGIMENASPDAPAPRWSDMITVDLATLGLQTVETIYYGTFSSFAPDLPGGLLAATLTCEYAEGGDPTTVDFVTGLNTAEWSYDRPEHVTDFGGVGHPRPPELYSFTTSIGSASTYTGYSYAGSLALDPARTLTCITLTLGPDSPFVSLRNPVGANPTWFTHSMSAITLEGPEGVPAATGGGCTQAPDPQAGFTEASISRLGAEHLIAGQDADPNLSFQSPAGYAPGPFGAKSSVLSGDGNKVWWALFDAGPNVEGDPQMQLWSVNTDGTGALRSSFPMELLSSGLHLTTNIDGSVVVADNVQTDKFYKASPGTGVSLLYDYTGIGDARGAMRLNDDGTQFVAVNVKTENVTVTDITVGSTTPQVVITVDSLVVNGVGSDRPRTELDINSSATRWMMGTRVFDANANPNTWTIFIGDGHSLPTTSRVTTERDDVSFSRFNMTDDGQTIAYCRASAIDGPVARCFIQEVGSSARTEIADEVENVGNLSLADNGSKAFMSTKVGEGGGQGFIYDVATGERYTGGSQWFAGTAPDFSDVKWSDDGRLFMAAVSGGIYVLHDGSVPAGFPTIDRILYRMNDDACSMTVRVEVNAPIGIERIFTLGFYRGLDASRGEIPGEQNPFYRGSTGGGGSKSTTFTLVEDGVWEREVYLTNSEDECASSLLSAEFSIRIILVEATTTRTVFADFVPVP